MEAGRFEIGNYEAQRQPRKTSKFSKRIIQHRINGRAKMSFLDDVEEMLDHLEFPPDEKEEWMRVAKEIDAEECDDGLE